MRVSLSVIALTLLFAAGLSHAKQNAQAPLPLIPAPATLERSPGAFTLRRDAPVVVRGDMAQALDAAQYFVELADATHGLHLALRPQEGAAEDGIEFTLDPDFPVGDDHSGEGYVLTVGAHGIRVVARSAHGLFYGGITLWQLLDAGGDHLPLQVPRVAITDHPRFAWRGLMLDSCRHMQSVEEIERLLDQMARHKLNVLHWHLTDDQGWRIEIKKYPKLTELGAWRTPATVHGTPPRYGGYYTQQQIRAIVAYAAARAITVVPEIEMPGHAQAAIAAYPEFGVTGARPPVSPDWGVHTYLYNVDDKTFAFLEDVLTEVMELFPSPYIHVGGDEAAKDQWQASPQVQQRMRDLGLADEAKLQGWFSARIEKFLAEHGRKMIGWDEILEGGVPPRATVMSWRGEQGGVDAAKSGHDVIMSPSPLMYFDHFQSALHDEPPGRPAVVSLQDVYAYEPVPHELEAAHAKHVLGAQANLWTEYMDTSARLEHAAFPRAAALAEVLWSPPQRRDWRDFLARLPAQIERYRAAHIAFADSAFAADFKAHAGSGSVQVEISDQAGFGQIRYASAGTVGATSAAYAKPVPLGADGRIVAATYAGAQALAAPREFRAPQLSRRDSDALASCVPGGGLDLRLPGPPAGEGVYRVNLFDPCWIYPAVDLGTMRNARVSLAALPYNFQLWKDIKNVATREPAGHLQVRIDGCSGKTVADLSARDTLGADERGTVTVQLPQGSGAHDLCFVLTRGLTDPLWVIGEIELER